MIVEFDPITLNVFNALEGSDATMVSQMLANIALAGTNHDVQVIADNATTTTDWLNGRIGEYRAVLSGPTLTDVVRKRVAKVEVTSPIQLNQTSTINIQITDAISGAPVNEVFTIPIVVNGGILVNDSITTNASGFASTEFKPSKAGKGTVSFGQTGLGTEWELMYSPVTGAGYPAIELPIFITAPTTATEQNWIETNDIKALAITEEKIAASIVDANLISQTNPSLWWNIKKAVVEDTSTVGLTDSVNNIVSDGIDHIYMNGFNGATPTIKKVNRRTFAVDGTLTYTNNNLVNRTDGLTFDGKYLWVASAGDLLRVNPVTMTLDSTITIDSSGGNIHALAWDGEFLYAFVRGGSTYPNQLLEITRNGTVRGATTSLSANNVKQIAIRQSTQKLALSGTLRQILVPIAHPAGSSNLSPVVISGLAVITVNFSASFGITATANGTAASDGINYWVGVTPSGGSKESLLRVNVDQPTGNSLLGSMDQDEIGIVYDLFYDGAYMWAITSEAGDPPTSTARRFIRKLQQVGTGDIELVQTIDMGPDVDPNAICVENDRVFVGNFAGIT